LVVERQDTDDFVEPAMQEFETMAFYASYLGDIPEGRRFG
jgi:hypothetical protein